MPSVWPLTSAPQNPSSITQYSSSSTARSGSWHGSTAKPAKRSGWDAIASAIHSLDRLAHSDASFVSPVPCTPGDVSDSTCTSIPASSISGNRRSPTSLKRSSAYCMNSGTNAPPSTPGNPGVAKCSSNVTIRTLHLLLRRSSPRLGAQEPGESLVVRAGGVGSHQAEVSEAPGRDDSEVLGALDLPVHRRKRDLEALRQRRQRHLETRGPHCYPLNGYPSPTGG